MKSRARGNIAGGGSWPAGSELNGLQTSGITYCMSFISDTERRMISETCMQVRQESKCREFHHTIASILSKEIIWICQNLYLNFWILGNLERDIRKQKTNCRELISPKDYLQIWDRHTRFKIRKSDWNSYQNLKLYLQKKSNTLDLTCYV